MTASIGGPVAIRAPYDPELEVGLASLPADIFGTENGPATIEESRALMASWRPNMASLTRGGTIDVYDKQIPGPQGAPEITVLVMSPTEGSGPRPVIYHVHGGGMVAGDRYYGAETLAEYVAALQVVVVSVEYRLAPEHPHPAPVEDCYAGLVWVARNAAALRIDPRRIVIMGGSAGAGLAASTALLARDRQGPDISHQVLGCPMLDDRMSGQSTSATDLHSVNFKQGLQNGWAALLGDAAGGPDVSAYASAARADDLSGLPPAYIDVGSSEILLDEAVDFATRLSHAGVPVELHVWPGGFHGFSSLVPHAALSRTASDTRLAYLSRVLL
ncbi:acetyl esterase/lipase [Rhodococcus sp. OK519]|uniref:alpha/beta hydrolase n=1 Tax=Rhodococcus sp. OK519 TaxID=2135729 RepID=UPI000D4F1100|nr:acetyl esterase/lipase [Rhodococcus sp. OK519]